jgi:hypothetical protein
LFETHQIHLARPAAKAPRQNIESLPDQEAPGNPLAQTSLPQMSSQHALNVSLGAKTFHGGYTTQSAIQVFFVFSWLALRNKYL